MGFHSPLIRPAIAWGGWHWGCMRSSIVAPKVVKSNGQSTGCKNCSATWQSAWKELDRMESWGKAVEWFGLLETFKEK